MVRCLDCQKLMTAADSKGNGGVYTYYRCLNCSRRSINADKAHEWVKMLLRELSISIHQDKWEYYFRKNIKEALADKFSKINSITRKLEEANDAVIKLEEKFILDAIDKTTYERWKAKYESSIFELENDLKENDASLEIDPELVKSIVEKICNLAGLYAKLPLHKKQQLLRLVLPGGLYLSPSGVQTERVNSLFQYKELNSKEIRVGRIGNLVPISASTPVGTRSGT